VYVDENGEFIFSFFLPGIGTLIDAALWGGTINLISNWNNINNFAEGIAAFGAGAGSGALMIVNPTLGITVGGALTGGAFGTLGGLTYGLSQYAGFKIYTGIAEKNIMKAIDNLGTNLGESVHDIGTNLNSLSSQDMAGISMGDFSSGYDLNSINVYAHKNGVVSVYTHIPNPISGAKPITNFYHYMDHGRLYNMLKRIKF